MRRGNDNYPRVPPWVPQNLLPIFGYPSTPNVNAQGTRWRYQERELNSDLGLDSLPIHHSSMQLLLLDNIMPRETSRRTRQSIPEPPLQRPIIDQRSMEIPVHDESKLSQDEQKRVLKKLKKEIYHPPGPPPQSIARRISFYYRENSRNDPNEKEKVQDEDGKRCAVCLEDFVPNQEVMITPCTHMFHEECIVPWVKTNGQCPVCRFAFFERLKNNTANAPPATSLFGEELASVIQAMDEALEWGSRTRYM